MKLRQLLFLVLLSAIMFPAFVSFVAGQDNDIGPIDGGLGAYLSVYVSRGTLAHPLHEKRVNITVVGEGWVKLEDGIWLSKWYKTVNDSTNLLGYVRFRIYSPQGEIRLCIRACAQVIEKTYDLGEIMRAPSYRETVICCPEFVIPEAPVLGTLGLSLAMLLGLGAFIIRPKRRIK